jgi:hypothetical protein
LSKLKNEKKKARNWSPSPNNNLASKLCLKKCIHKIVNSQ